MRDVLMEIYDVLKADPAINTWLDPSQDITFNRYPDIGTLTGPIIVIEETDEPLEREFADDDSMAFSYLVQVDVFTKVQAGINARKLKDEISYRVFKLLKEQLGMTNTSNGTPEFSREFQVYRSARRYEKTYYRQDIIGGN